ncbi:YolD-like family protein [Ornithinibacillus caprae]|nr:YolD-like family protein [Ornithinibacillus caprae]
MVNDRGSIKWTSLMLPEHVQILKNLDQEDKKIQKPILDEQEFEIINQRLIEAATQGNHIELSVYENGVINRYTGLVRINKERQQICIADSIFNFNNIISVN